LTEGINQRLLIGHRKLDNLIESSHSDRCQARQVGRERRHHSGCNKVAADQIQRARAGFGASGLKPLGKPATLAVSGCSKCDLIWYINSDGANCDLTFIAMR